MTNPAETYEAYMVPALFGPWARRLVESVGPAPGERVLDAGCGTGVVARELARAVQPGGSVTGIDPSPNMLEVARAAAERAGASIDWHEGRAEHLPFDENSFDLVTCQFALMFFADRAAGLAEMRRVLREDGRIAISVWQGIEQHPFYKTLDGVIGRQLGESAVGDIFVLGDAGALSDMLRAAGFRDIEVQSASETACFPDPPGFLAGEIDVDTAAIPSMQQLGDEERQRIVAAISDEMQDPLRAVTQGDSVMLPFHAHIVTARR